MAPSLLFALWGCISIAVQQQSSSNTFSDLCRVFGVTCPIPLILNEANGVRGVFLSDKQEIPPNTTVLQIPLQVCLRDDEGPLANQADVQWSTRLAASVLQLQETNRDAPDSSSTEITQQQQQDNTWLALLPDADALRASLPIHWNDVQVLPLSLGLAVDISYFARAQAVAQLSQLTKNERACHDALDVVQTRSCRVSDNTNEDSLRLLAPLFDMLNHGGTASNCQFLRQDDDLIVTTTQHVSAGCELSIDYGETATRPVWKCLASYGFVPSTDDGNEVEPLVVNNIRYEQVGMESIAYELVEDVSILLKETDVALTPQVCSYIADCAEQTVSADEKNDALVQDKSSSNDTTSSSTTKRLLLELRQSRQRTLMAFARGLREFHIE